MNYLDLYLQKNNCKRYDVYKKTGISQQVLSTHKNKKIEKYSGKILMALAETLNKTPGDVLNELINIEKETPDFQAFNPEELLIALVEKYDTIVIRGAYCSEIYKIMRGKLSENEVLGVELGSAGVLTILVYAISEVRSLFTNSNKTSKEIEKRLDLYKIKSISKEKLILKLKQLDY